MDEPVPVPEASVAEPVTSEQAIIAPRPAPVVEVAPMLMLVKARQFDQAIKHMQEQMQALVTGFSFGRGVDLRTHQVHLDTDKGTITISPIQSETKT